MKKAYIFSKVITFINSFIHSHSKYTKEIQKNTKEILNFKRNILEDVFKIFLIDACRLCQSVSFLFFLQLG